MPLNTLSFLKMLPDFHNSRFYCQSTHELKNPSVLLSAYKWLVCYLLQTTAEKFSSAKAQGKDAFTTKNDSQVYAARTLSIAFIEHYSLEIFYTKLCLRNDLCPRIQAVLTKLMLLFGYYSLEKHLSTLYQGGYVEGADAANLIRDTILELCEEIKPESVALVDAISPTDFVLNSALGKSDGQIYKNLQQTMMQTPKGFERDSYWKEIAVKIQSKM
jgi:acyl-CoA oxidase